MNTLTNHEVEYGGIDALFAFFDELFHLPRNRAAAEEVRALSDLLRGDDDLDSDRARPSPSIAISLNRTRRNLRKLLEGSRQSSSNSHQVRWGQRGYPTPPEAPAAIPPAWLAPAATTGDAHLLAAPTPATVAEQAASSPARFAPLISAAIDLCDWLQRAQEEGSISSARALEVTERKAAAVLVALHVERIDRSGAFDDTCQEIVDAIPTDSETADMLVAETVQCGYRVANSLIRPQKVLVYRYAARRVPVSNISQ